MTVWHEERGSGEPVVLLHSSVADSGMWDPQWEPLGERFPSSGSTSGGTGARRA